jgi:hypothetical protein
MWRLVVTIMVAHAMMTTSSVINDTEYEYDYEYDYGEYEYDYVESQEGQCFDWASLGTTFSVYEVSCQWCHNKVQIRNGKDVLLEFRTLLFSKLDLEIYDGAGQYQGDLKYNEFSQGFELRIYDCNKQFSGQVEEGHLDTFINQHALQTKVNIYNGHHEFIGYSTREEFYGKRIEISNEMGSKVWKAERSMTQGLKTYTCDDPKWQVTRLGAYGELPEDADIDPRLQSVKYPMYISAVVAIEALKNIGDYDTCTNLLIALIVIVVIAIIGAGIVCFFCLKSRMGYNKLQE